MASASAVLGFARPDSTVQIILGALRYRPELGIRAFIDTPARRAGEPNYLLDRHFLLVKSLRDIESREPRLQVQLRTANYGIEQNLVTALDAVFEEFDYALVLEDDCVPSRYFFDFMDFAQNSSPSLQDKVGITSGSNHLFFPFNRLRQVALLSILSHVWGRSIS